MRVRSSPPSRSYRSPLLEKEKDLFKRNGQCHGVLHLAINGFYNFTCSFRRPSVLAEQTRHPNIEVLMPWRLQSHLVTVRPLYFDGGFRSFSVQAEDIMILFANFADIWHYDFSVFSLKDEPWGKQYLYISKGNGKVIFLMFPCFLEMKKDLKIFRFKDQLTGTGTPSLQSSKNAVSSLSPRPEYSVRCRTEEFMPLKQSCGSLLVCNFLSFQTVCVRLFCDKRKSD